MAHLLTPDPADQPQLDSEGLDCYRLALDFQPIAQRLIPKGRSDLRDQLRRASASVALNVAEGVGRRSAPDRCHFLAIARGSAMESAAIVAIARSLGLAPIGLCGGARMMLIRIVQMLTKLEAKTAGRT